MNRTIVSFSKFLLSSINLIVILLSTLLIYLIFDMWIHEGIPPLENLKFSIAAFLIIILLLIISHCVKYISGISLYCQCDINR